MKIIQAKIFCCLLFLSALPSFGILLRPISKPLPNASKKEIQQFFYNLVNQIVIESYPELQMRDITVKVDMKEKHRFFAYAQPRRLNFKKGVITFTYPRVKLILKEPNWRNILNALTAHEVAHILAYRVSTWTLGDKHRLAMAYHEDFDGILEDLYYRGVFGTDFLKRGPEKIKQDKKWRIGFEKWCDYVAISRGYPVVQYNEFSIKLVKPEEQAFRRLHYVYRKELNKFQIIQRLPTFKWKGFLEAPYSPMVKLHKLSGAAFSSFPARREERRAKRFFPRKAYKTFFKRILRLGLISKKDLEDVSGITEN